MDRAKYFGADAKATWGLLKKNGTVVAGGKQLTEKDLPNIPVGTILYQNTPAVKDANGKVVDYDHVAIYMGNGMVYQHNSDYASKTGVSKGNLNVLSFGEFSKLFPTYGATIPELTKKGGTTTAAPGRTPPASPTPGAKPAADAAWNPTPPTLPKGSYKAGITKVTQYDRLAIPAGNGTFNLVQDQGVAKSAIASVHAQVVKQFGKDFTALSL